MGWSAVRKGGREGRREGKMGCGGVWQERKGGREDERSGRFSLSIDQGEALNICLP